ncbi:helix-turn-helix domain-containing protein [uncultured Erythrobacter sp.]|uniref:helix-turn-helix domain-containing protein n=1 Tax=uncultured Erythrobacter sp. TaxID=263913 RepID=UPI002627D60F|nr:helix-turn-helix domain-containing protein [uncultured Erythrobacter sp.]
MHAETGNAISIRFALPSAELAPYVTTYYYTEVVASPSEPVLEDYLHPEWPNLRFMEQAGWAHSAIGDAPVVPTPAVSATGPTSLATRFRISSGRSWGIGLMPLGWAAFIDGHASDYADTVSDAMADSAFAAFHALGLELTGALAEGGGDYGEELAIIERHMDALVPSEGPATAAIAAISAALVDPELATVAELADRVAMNIRSLERLTKRAFGFTPKLLLRRQRFLRSLSQFMLDPSLKWLSTLDYHYHDQAHFVRDFKRFMGMSPSTYAALDKPFLVAAARARMAIAGEAVQGLHDPAASES